MARAGTYTPTAQDKETMPVHVVSVDQGTQRLRVRNADEEVIVLEVPAAYLANLQVGDQLILTR